MRLKIKILWYLFIKKGFKVISKDEESFLKAQKLLQELISKNHIIKDELNSESVKLLTKDEVNNSLNSNFKYNFI